MPIFYNQTNLLNVESSSTMRVSLHLYEEDFECTSCALEED